MSVTTEVLVDAWMMTNQNEPMTHVIHPHVPCGAHEAFVEVAGCGVCHTDLSFLYGGVKTRGALPLTLGHEISGIVREVGAGADSSLVGRAVVIPAVLPCGECALCRAGHRSVCRKQIMPGNDRNGGFASHVTVPARWLCPVPDAVLRTHELWELSVVADAVSTPFQAVKNSGLAANDLAICVGVGGIGVYGVQIAVASGAKVIALDVNDQKLEQARAAGAHAAFNIKGVTTKDVRKMVKEQAEKLSANPFLWKIFEMSGTRAGQETAYALLTFGASLAVVGFTMDKVEIPLSNLMAFEATARGNWGSDPTIYPELLQWIGDGRVTLKPFVEKHPLAEINRVLEDAHHGTLDRRAVLAPG